MSAITTRPFEIDDYDRALAIWNAVEGLEICEGDSPQEIAEYLKRNRGMSRVAEVDGVVAGVVLCGHDGRRGWIYHLAVAEEHRGRGIARRLVDECLDRLRMAGLRRAIILVSRENPPGHDFWAGNGWEDIPGAIAMTREL
jgi:N-acetylglutamate synthase